MRRGLIAWCVLAWLLLLLGAQVGCSKPEPPTIKPHSARLKTVSATGVTLETVLEAHNPNSIPLKARKVTATLTFDKTVKLGPIDVPHKLSLPAGKITKLTVDIPASWESAAQVTGLAASSPKIPYVIEGTVVIGGKNLNAEVPFEIEGTVSRAELLKAGLEGLPTLNLPGLLQ
jgi:LEA14-like dessication related protein